MADVNLSGIFGSGVKSIQRGTIALSAVASNTATISAVNTAKAEVRYLGIRHTANRTADSTQWFAHLVLTNSTTITATSTSATTALEVSFEVTEHY